MNDISITRAAQAANQNLKPEIYLSYDVEANGPVPGLYSMLSFGVASFTLEEGFKAAFTRNLQLLPGAGECQQTFDEFWAKFPEAYIKARVGALPIKQAIHEFIQWVTQVTTGYKAVNLAGPAAWDFQWILYYLAYAKGDRFKDIGFACMDMRSYAAGMLKKGYREVGKRSYPQEWFESNLPHTHVALDDAVEQGAIVFNMMRENLGLPKAPFFPPLETTPDPLVNYAVPSTK